MNENHEIREQELATVSGGRAEPTFASIEERFARENDCRSCHGKSIHRNYEMCLEVYNQLLAAYVRGESIDPRCPRRR